FHAGLDGAVTGPFDILLDDLHEENFMLGQPRTVAKSVVYDQWVSYALPDFIPPPPPFNVLRYHIATTIHPDNSLDGDTTVDFRALTGTEQLVSVQLA